MEDVKDDISVSRASSRSSSTASAAARARARAEAARARALYGEREAKLKTESAEKVLEKAKLDAKLEALTLEREAAAAIAQAEALEAAVEIEDGVHLNRNVKSLSQRDIAKRTSDYVTGRIELDSTPCGGVGNNVSQFSPAHTGDALVTWAAPHINKPPTNTVIHTVTSSDSRHGAIPAQVLRNSPWPDPGPHSQPTEPWAQHYIPQHEPISAPTTQAHMLDIAKFLARRELVTTGLTQFDDHPESFKTWQSSFSADVITKREGPSNNCPLHNKPHPLRKCRGFRAKTLEERKAFLMDNRICFKCCTSSSHLAKDCEIEVKCSECESEGHSTVMHPGPPPWTTNAPTPAPEDGGEGEEDTATTTVNSLCTELKEKVSCGRETEGASKPFEVNRKKVTEHNIGQSLFIKNENDSRLAPFIEDTVFLKTMEKEDKQNECKGWHQCKEPRTPIEPSQTKNLIIRLTQGEASPVELAALTDNKDIPKNSSLIKFNPVLDEDIIRIGGRLNHAQLDSGEKNPIILLRQSHVSVPLVRHYHNHMDLFRSQWRKVQSLGNRFWSRWKTKYLPTLQGRGKWKQTRRNLQKGDLVLLKDSQVPCNEWPMALVASATHSGDGRAHCRRVRSQNQDIPVIHHRSHTSSAYRGLISQF